MVEDRHPEPRCPPGDCASDPPHPDDAQRLAKHIRAKQLRRRPAVPAPFAYQPVRLRNPPRHRQNQRPHKVGRRLRQDIRGVGDDDAAACRGGDIHVVVAYGVDSHDLQTRGRVQHLGIHALRQGHCERVGLGRRLQEFLACRRAIVGLSDEGEAPGQLGHDRVREAPAHVDGRHGLGTRTVLYHFKTARSRPTEPSTL